MTRGKAEPESAVAQEALWNALTLGPADADPARFLDDLVASSALSDDDRSFLLEQGPARLLVYRRLVRNNLREVIELSMPRAFARLAELSGRGSARSLQSDAFDAFCAERGSHSHYLRDVAFEFLDFCEHSPAFAASFPRHLLELGRLEAAEIEIAAAPNQRELRSDADAHEASSEASSAASGDELELDRAVGFIEACRLFRFDRAVHRLPANLDDRSVPAAQATYLLVYRSPEHEVRYLELSLAAWAILRRLLEGQSLRDALVEGSAETGTELSDAVLAGTSRLLADLAELGVLLGAQEPR